MTDQLPIGINKDGKVLIDMERSPNCHIALMGRSGSGKSVAGQKIIKNIIADGTSPIIVFDVHRLFSNENIFPKFRQEIIEESNEINVYTTGIKLPLFTPLKHSDGNMDDLFEVATYISDIFSSAMKLGYRQRECLFEAVEFVAGTSGYEKCGIAALGKALNMVDDEKAGVVHDRLAYLFRRNIFRDGDIFIENKKINILRLSNFAESAQAMIVEIVLAYLWRLANAGAFLENGLCLFLDECQNLNWGKNGIISKIMSEGRKLRVQLIFITQSVGLNGKNDMTRCLLQTGNQLYFSPPENEISTVAKLISVKRQNFWQMQLKSLEVGECVVNGPVTVNGVSHSGALKIKIKDEY